MPEPRELLADQPGKRMLLLGNEAIARAIIEGGVGVVTTYPGTPASEIGDTISEIAREARLYMEYSTNEIVAVEVAAGAANSNVRALTAMKHVGLNVAADAVMTLAYIGVKAGHVIVAADDPECYSSQNEQDTRFYALLSNLPCLEPSDPQEAKDMTLSAFDISETLELPVLLRTTTRVNHARGPVAFGEIRKLRVPGEFVREMERMVMVPAFARPQHAQLLEKLEKARQISEASIYNRILAEGKGEYGIISSGGAVNYAVEASEFVGLNAGILKLGVTHPLPEKRIGEFLKSYEKIVVVEELEPYLEMQIKAIAKDHAPDVEIFGKMTKEYFSRRGELSTKSVASSLSEITDRKLPVVFDEIEKVYSTVAKDLPARPPVLCAGCPHRASFYIMKKVGGEKAIYPTDIGCYALGIAKPLGVGDILVCMGSSISTAQGMNRATGRTILATVGDSTFFHATMPGLVNAVYNNAKVTLVVLDNSTTAMTGHQPHPGTGATGMGNPTERVSIEKIAEGCGVKYVRVISPFRVKKATEALKEAVKHDGPSVVIFRAPCSLLETRQRRREGIETIPAMLTDKCTHCQACVKLLGCPALAVEEGKVKINVGLCVGCGLCASVCPYDAIKCRICQE